MKIDKTPLTTYISGAIDEMAEHFKCGEKYKFSICFEAQPKDLASEECVLIVIAPIF